MSLVQVLVGMAVSVLIGTFVLQSSLQNKRIEVLMSLNSEVSDMVMEIERVLLSPIACFNTMYRADPNDGLGHDDINHPNGFQNLIIMADAMDVDNPQNSVEFLKVGDPVPKTFNPDPNAPVNQARRLTVHEINLKYPKKRNPADPDPVLIRNAINRLDIEVVFLKHAGNQEKNNPDSRSTDSPGGAFIVRRIPVAVEVNTNGNIQGCSSLAQMDVAKRICDGLKGQFSNQTALCDLSQSPAIKIGVCDALQMRVDNEANPTRCVP